MQPQCRTPKTKTYHSKAMAVNRIYISGSITKDIENAPAKFEQAEQRIRKLLPEAEVINPMKLPHEPHSTWEQFMALDLEELSKCDTIWMLPCWKESQGARLEHAMAKRNGLVIVEAVIHEIEEPC